MVSNFWKLKLTSRDEKKKAKKVIWAKYVAELCKKNKDCDISKIEEILKKVRK